MMANRTRGARGGFDQNRTLDESPRHRLADSAETPKEKHSLHFWFGGGEISFENGKGVFLSGFCPPSIRAEWRGEMQGSQAKISSSQLLHFYPLAELVENYVICYYLCMNSQGLRTPQLGQVLG